MSFHEKSNAAMLAILVAVYGWYFATTAGLIFGGDLPAEAVLAASGTKMVFTVIAVIVTSILAHVLIAIMAPSEADDTSDERDKLIEMRGDQRGGVVLGVFAVFAMGLALLGQPAHLFANAVLAGLVTGSVVAGLSRLIDYRRSV